MQAFRSSSLAPAGKCGCSCQGKAGISARARIKCTHPGRISSEYFPPRCNKGIPLGIESACHPLADKFGQRVALIVVVGMLKPNGWFEK